MKTILWIGLGIVAAIALVVAGLGVGWTLWGHSLWAAGPFATPGYSTGTEGVGSCGEWESGIGPGRFAREKGESAKGMMDPEGALGTSCPGWGYGTGPSTSLPGGEGNSDSGATGVYPDMLTIEEAHEAVERYVTSLGDNDLKVAEVMEFERNFYAIIQESDTGIGAMELLVDKWTGSISPEMGPNMMWNARYGMHGRGGMMGGASITNTVTPEEALEIAQRWLDVNRPGVTVEEHTDPFYGYYTIHTLKGDEIEGMLSVHGRTGQVWYHTWHGEFIQMIEEEGEDH